jgi:hypothetical protein
MVETAVMETRSQPAEPVAAPVVTFAEELVREVTPAPLQDPAATARPEQVLKLDWQTDLTQIETSPEKLQAARTQTAEETPVARPKRVRAALSSAEEEPLLQVETHRPDAATPAPGA